MTFSIIIVSWNALPLLKRCLPSVAATEYSDCEIILADNASDDGSVEWVADAFPGVRIVHHPENWAFAKGNNRAVPHARGDILLFLNNDVIVPPDWLNPIAAAFGRDPMLVAAQPKLLQPDVHPPRFEYSGGSGGHLDRYGFPFTRGRIFAKLEDDHGQYDDEAEIFWATGAAMAVRRDAFEREGGFDEAFIMHMEEIDLCWRMRRHGGSIRVIPQSTVYHIGGASLPQNNPRKTYLNFRNSLLMLRKNLPDDRWRPVRRMRYLLDHVAMLRAASSGNLAEAHAILQAHRDAARMYANYAGPPVGVLVKPSYDGSIVVDYFLRKRRSFADLPQSQFSVGGSVR